MSVVTDFCHNVADDPDVEFAFRLAAYELTENLVKYSVGGLASVCIEVVSTVRGPEIVLTTENDAEPERLSDAMACLEAVERALDPIGHFDRLVRESIASPNESRLGLGRLRAEGDLTISHQVTDNRLMIQARRLARRASEVTPS